MPRGTTELAQPEITLPDIQMNINPSSSKSVSHVSVPSPSTCGSLVQRGTDQRPFVVAVIKGNPFKSLVDTGATRSYLGPLACQKLSPPTPLKPDRPAPPMVMANGEIQDIPGEIKLPVQIHDKEGELTFRIAPSLAYEAILGMDALAVFGDVLYRTIIGSVLKGTPPDTSGSLPPRGSPTRDPTTPVIMSDNLHVTPPDKRSDQVHVQPNTLPTVTPVDPNPAPVTATQIEWLLTPDPNCGIAEVDDLQRQQLN